MVKYKFKDIAINSTLKKKPVEDDKYHYIGLEHLDSGSLQVTRYGSEVAPKGEKLIMKKGDVLFGKRRAYQKKVGIAPFDGIFSAHGMVLRPKEDVVDKDFFPLFINSDYFLDAAIKISVGSLSPTINWGDLKELEFELPGLDEQRKLAKILWAAEETKQAYKTLLQKTDELVKAKFEEMFFNKKEEYPSRKVKDLFTLQMGKTPSRSNLSLWDSADFKWITVADMSNYSLYTEDTKEKISKKAVQTTGIKIVPQNTVIMSFKLSIGKVAITSEDIYTNEAIMAFLIKNKKQINNMFLKYYLSFNNWNDAMNIAVKGMTLNKETLNEIDFLLPSLQIQNEFVNFAQQAEKSKQQLQKSLDSLNDIMRALINENLK